MRKILLVILAMLPLPALAAPCAGFVDVEDTNPFCPSVAWIKSRGITLGCSANAYCPDANVSRLQMAAFMMRLGDALVPPNVLVVAATGGAFHTIQAAINHAATIATPTVPVVIRVAPGTYPEGITLVPNVEVQGTSIHSTLLVPATCVGPSGSAVVMAPYSRISGMTIQGCNNGILFDGGSVGPGIAFVDTAIRDMQILQSSTGIKMAGVVSSVGPIERTRISTYGSTVNIGISVEYAFFSLSDVSIDVVGNTTSIGLKTAFGATGTLERVSIGAAGPGGPTNIFAIDALSGSLSVRDSTIGGISNAIRTSGTATAKVANSAMNGTILGGATTCFNTWRIGTLLPFAC